MTTLSGKVTLQGSSVQGVPVAVIDTNNSNDPSNWSLAGTDVTDVNGDWEVTGLASGATERYHALVQYDDGSQFYNVESLPYLSTAGIAIPDSAIARYTFDDADTSGTTAIDIWNGNDATINGATTGVAGVSDTYDSGEAYSLDGTDDYIDTPVAPVSGGFSIAIWVNLDSQSNGSFARCADGSNNQATLRYDGSNQEIEWYTYDGSTAYGLGFTGVSSISNSTPTHLIATFDPTGGYELYKDGSSVGTSSETTFIVPSATFGIGADTGGGDNIPADLDDPRFYDKALSSTEASNLYNTGSISG